MDRQPGGPRRVGPRTLPDLRLTTRREREGTDDHPTAALKVHALRTELDAIEAKAVAEDRDLTADEAERVDAIGEQEKAMLDHELTKRSMPRPLTILGNATADRKGSHEGIHL